jgi:CheY-like chemotaxis protein
MIGNIERSLILLVEDDDNDVLLMSRAFRLAGVKNPLQIAKDGEIAIAYLKGADDYGDRERYPLPSLILLDLKMPRKSGFEVLSRIRQDSHVKKLITIILTASREHQDINRAYGLGINSYIVKPSKFDDLVEAVRTIQAYWLRVNHPPEI